MPLFASTKGLITGQEEVVGVRHVKTTTDHTALRIFYPATFHDHDSSSTVRRKRSSRRSVRWFQEKGIGLSLYLRGMLHVGGRAKVGSWLYTLLAPFIICLACCLPPLWQRLPETAADLPVLHNKKKYPVIVLSHGLTGSGQELSLMATAWAKQGYVVVSVHHEDGSSACVPLVDGTKLFFQHCDMTPDGYDRTSRPRQMEQRALEMRQALTYMQNHAEFSSVCDFDAVVAAGFSYGAATCALAAVQDESPFHGTILLDGWFHIHISDEIDFPQPQLAFDRRNLLTRTKPTIFINSQQFADYPQLRDSTRLLAGDTPNKPATNLHVIHGTTHGNFCDMVFWAPQALLTKAGAIGSADARQAYQEIVDLSSDFLRKHFPSN